MSKLGQIAMQREKYLDRESDATMVRENVIRKILEIESRLNLNNHIRLELEMFYNEELEEILNDLKKKLKIIKSYRVNNVDLEFTEMGPSR